MTHKELVEKFEQDVVKLVYSMMGPCVSLNEALKITQVPKKTFYRYLKRTNACSAKE